MSFIKKKFLTFAFLLLSSNGFTSSKINAEIPFNIKMALAHTAGLALVRVIDKIAEFVCSDENMCYDSCYKNFWLYSSIIPITILVRQYINNHNRPIIEEEEQDQ